MTAHTAKHRLPQLLSDHTSWFVLVVLCLVYSVVTYDVQHPTTPSAGSWVGRKIAREATGPTVVIWIRDTEGDHAFADAVEAVLVEAGARVERVAGIPQDINRKLRELGRSGAKLDYVATHHVGAAAGPLQPDRLDRLKTEHPSLANVQIVTPQSYYWPTFFTRANLVNVINRNADVAIIAIGMTMVIIAAGIDLSVGSVLAFAAVVTAFMIERLGGANAGIVMLALSGLIATLAAAGLGAFSGVATTYFNVPSFVVTLSMMMVARGGAYILAGTPEGVNVESDSFTSFANSDIVGVPSPIWIMAALFVAAHLMMTKTALGRYIYAVGGNAEAARLSGVPVNAIRITVFSICGGLAGLCGVLNASRFDTGLPAAGELYELQVIAAVVVGGASLSGGSGRILGTLSGALILAVIENGLNMARVETYEKMVVFGALILAAVLLDQFKHRK